MNSNTLQALHVSKYFPQENQRNLVLDEVSLRCEQKKTYAITGVSGTGKSTLMHILAGLDKPSSGVVQFNDSSLQKMSPTKYQQFLNQSIGLVFQLPYLIKELTVLENVMLPGLIAKKPEDECKEKAYELLKQVGLKNKVGQKPMSLSGGQQQRVALARALINNPVFLLADEPTGNLDIETGKEMIDLLFSLQQATNMGIIVSTHDRYVAERMQHRYELRDGTLHSVKK